MASVSTNAIIEQLNQARNLAFSSKEAFPQVLRQVFQFVNNPDRKIQEWCAVFLRESFMTDESKVSLSDKVDLAIDALDGLIVLSNIEDTHILKNCIDTALVVFKLVFRYVAENDGCTQVWLKLNELKNSLTSKFQSTFPLPPSDTDEHDQFRNLDIKIELIKFIVLVIDYQSRTPNSSSFSLSHVNSNHSLIKQSIEAEAFGLLDVLLKVLTSDVMVTPLVTALLNHLSVIAKRKPQFVTKIVAVVEQYDTETKLQSNYETVEQYKLSKKYVDRCLKILINFMLKNQLVPSNYTNALNKKINILVGRGEDIRKKNILASSPEDSNIRKRKFEGFVNSSKKIKTNDYKSLYCLTEPDNELNNFDLSTLPQNILVSMTLSALNKASNNKLNKALDIIRDRCKYALENFAPTDTRVKKENDGADDEDDDDYYDYRTETEFTLPPPTELSFQEKKNHINIIIKNFFRLAEKDVSSYDEKQDLNGASSVSKELTKIAIKTWKKSSWFVILTRLASRGMRQIDTSKPLLKDDDTAESRDVLENEGISNLIRQAIFDYFLDDVHARVDFIIEWLNEEWYSEKVFNEDRIYEELKEKHLAEYEKKPLGTEDIESKVQEELETHEIPTPIYNKWTGKVLDAIIPFLEPGDRKIFIRLLSDLPYLNKDLVSRIKSLLYDPGRSKIGFLSLQFLIMYRPPVKAACLEILGELSQSDQEDLKDEAVKLLKKYE